MISQADSVNQSRSSDADSKTKKSGNFPGGNDNVGDRAICLNFSDS